MLPKLIILDINGLLCHKERLPQSEIDAMPDSDEYLKRRIYIVRKHTDVDKFLEWCFDNYHVAFWSSTTSYNAKPIIDQLLNTSDIPKRAKFIWYRDRTRLDPDYGVNNDIKEHDTVKTLSDVWSHPYVNQYRLYSNTNTLLVDDSARKTRFNHPDNVVNFDIPFDYDLLKANIVSKFLKLSEYEEIRQDLSKLSV